MRQAITTKYIGPSNVRGSRIKAIARKRSNLGAEMSLTKHYGHGNTDEEHCEAAKMLATKLGWSGLWVAGGNMDENGNVYVNVGLKYANADVQKYGFGITGTDGADWFYVA